MEVLGSSAVQRRHRHETWLGFDVYPVPGRVRVRATGFAFVMATHRGQRLRFDSGTFSLVTAGPTMPSIERDLDYSGEAPPEPGVN